MLLLLQKENYRAKETRRPLPVYKSTLMIGKARVTPTTSKTGCLKKSTPRTDMSGLLLMCWAISNSLPGLVELPGIISLFGDSKCSVLSVDSSKILGTLMGNRVKEVNYHMESSEKRGIKVDQLHHWSGKLNIADLATKGKATLKDV